MQRVGRLRARALGQPLQVGLDLVERRRVDQLAQLLLAEQLAQQVAVERERRRAALRVRRVALVHVRRDVVEQQRRRERRGGRRLDLDEAQLARVQPAQQLVQARHVEHVAQALAVGLEHDRELRVALGDLEQRLALEPLLPQRRAAARVGARDQQRAAGVLAEAGAEQGRAAELADDEVLELVRLDHHEVRAGRLVGVGQVDDDAVVGPDRVRLEAVALADAGAEREPPGGVHAAAVRAEDAQPPVADLVAEALDHDRAVARHDARRRLLLAQEVDEVAGGELVEVVVALERASGPASTASRAKAPIASPSSRGRPSPSPFQNGTAAGHAGSGRDDHAVARDLLDPPARGAEQERLARAAPRRPSPRRARRRGGRPGRLTENSPRSGIVPALVIASARAPRRARIVPATRSQTIRARSSPNSSDG